MRYWQLSLTRDENLGTLVSNAAFQLHRKSPYYRHRKSPYYRRCRAFRTVNFRQFLVPVPGSWDLSSVVYGGLYRYCVLKVPDLRNALLLSICWGSTRADALEGGVQKSNFISLHIWPPQKKRDSVSVILIAYRSGHHRRKDIQFLLVLISYISGHHRWKQIQFLLVFSWRRK